MSYMALYRKFRPDNFNDVKGQDHIVTTLRNQIKAGRIGHAYLFTGTRGTGKTTVAKLLAKTVNCEHPEEGNPCNECSMCRAISAGSSMNVIEIDAASNNGVDNVREIVEEVRYSPTEGRYKVYIIDEVHMLTTGAFNALLKTIEEPPSYVIFILATTEAQKIPLTILSRCQRYDFKRLSTDTITDRLKDLMREEQIDAEDKALRYVARMADGSMRDALSLMDQCISYYLGSRITYDNVLEVLGAVDIEIFAKLLRGILNQDIPECVRILDETESGGRELGQFVIDFIWYLRNLLLIRTMGEAADIITEITTENLSFMQREAESLDDQTLIRYIRVLSELSNQLRYAARKRVLVEIGIIRLCKPEMETNYDALIDRIKQLEDKVEKGIPVSAAAVPASGQLTKPAEAKPKQAEKQVILPAALPEDIRAAANSWKSIVSQIVRKAPALGPILSGATLSIAGEGLMIVVTDSLDKELLDRENHMKLIKDTISQIIHKQVQVNTRYLDKEKERIEEVPDLTKLVNMPIEYE